MKLGARIIKTGIAITLSLYIAMFFHLEPPVYAAVAAIFAVQPSIHRSYQTIFEQIQGNVIGALVAILLVLSIGNDPIIIGVAAVIIIALHLKLHLTDTIPLSVVTAIVIMEATTQHFIEFAITRFLIVMIGVVSAFVVNLIFLPPKYETKLYLKLQETSEEIIKWIRLTAIHTDNHMMLKKELEKLREDLVHIDQLYMFYKEERSYTKKGKFAKNRKLVLFRQMIITTKKSRYLLKDLHRYENDLRMLPEQVQLQIRGELENLTNFHEHILLKVSGKVRSYEISNFVKREHNKAPIIQSLMQLYKNQEITDEMWLHIFPVIGLMVDYYDELEHLDQLANTFHHYHQDMNEIEQNEEI